MRQENVQERLEGVIEDYLVILPGMHRAHLHRGLEWRNFRLATTGSRPRMELEMVVGSDGFLARLGNKGDPDLNLELSPSCFCDFERWLVNVACWIGVGIMKLECDTLYKIAQVICAADDVRVGDGRSASDCHCPAVSVVGRAQGLTFLRREHNRSVAIDDGTLDTQALYAQSCRGAERNVEENIP